MSNASDFIIENGVLKKYVGPGGDVVIPETVEEIGAGAFADNKSISGIQMHNGVHKIGKRAFYNCRSLENIAFSNRLILVGEDAFSFYTKLETLIFPDSLKIPNKEVSAKTATTARDKATKKLWRYELKGGKICLLEYKGNEQSVTIPAYIEETSVTVIAPGTFVGPHRRGTSQRELAISKIISVTIEEGVREIAGRAFCWCKNLETIRIPKSVKKISAYRFDEARQKLLSDAAFVECPNLTIHAPAGSYAETYAKENNIPFVAE